MDTKQKNDKLQFIVQRYDGYYHSISLMGNWYLVINAAVLSGLMTGYYISGREYVGSGMSLLVIVMLLCNFVSITYTLDALKPIVDDKLSTLEYTSVFYGVIGDNPPEHYEELRDRINPEKGNQDLQPQATRFSWGMEGKFNELAIAARLIGIQLLCLMVFVLYIVSKISGILA